jgi:hypothetical protein
MVRKGGLILCVWAALCGACHNDIEIPVQPGTVEYGIRLSQKSGYTFSGLTAGYAAAPAKAVTVTNAHRAATGELQVSLSGEDAAFFEVSPDTLPSISESGREEFHVSPKANLPIGTYNARVTVTGGNDIEADFSVSFSVYGVIELNEASPVDAPDGWTFGSNTYTLVDGAKLIIRGSAAGRRVEVPAGAEVFVTLRDAALDNSAGNGAAFGLGAGAAAHITLVGTNTLISPANCAGLQVPDSAELFLHGIGNLTSTGGVNGSGIGGGNNTAAGDISIQESTITATGGQGAAGIGGGSGGGGGSVSIQRARVTASGGTGASSGAGIGGGSNGDGGTITIKSGSNVRATGGAGGAGMGGGHTGNGGNITLEGGTFILRGGAGGAGIGGGTNGNGGNIRILNCENLQTVGESGGAGIGGGSGGNSGSIQIEDGIVKAVGAANAAGLGGGSGREAVSITITGGAVFAASGAGMPAPASDGAGIGGGLGGGGGSINVEGGSVIAMGGTAGAGIGDGNGGSGGTFTANGGKPVIFASSFSDSGEVNPVNGISGATVQANLYATADTVLLYDIRAIMTGDFTVPSGAVFVIPLGFSIWIEAGNTFTNNGKVINNGSIYRNGGTLVTGDWSGFIP